MTSCCGAAPRDITIGLTTSTLVFLYCDRCETRQWYRDGVQVELGAVKNDAAATWNRKHVGV